MSRCIILQRKPAVFDFVLSTAKLALILRIALDKKFEELFYF